MRRGKVKEANIQQKFLEARVDRPVVVEGYWAGNFMGKIVPPTLTRCTFEIIKVYSGQLSEKEAITIPYGIFVKFREPTDSERQITISEVAGDITV